MITPSTASHGHTATVAIDQLIEAEEAAMLARMPKARAMFDRSSAVMPGGVTSSWASTRPVALWVDRGLGGHVWDVDGNEYVDLHAGYGVNVVGHGHPAIVEAVQRRVTMGTHFAQPTPDSIEVAEMLGQRFGLPMWRFTNSGTEATMDAIHLMRAITGRDLIIKVEGSYHGHHDLTNVSLWKSSGDLGPIDDPVRDPGPGIPRAFADLVRIVPFNDLAAVERVCAAHPGVIAGMIVEPMMMNAGIIPPVPGYLDGLRQRCHANGALLAFDEVKTGLVVAWGGAVELFGVRPDIICLAKALGGGIPCGAVGGTAEVMSAITDGRYDQVGTFNGNPLTMAAARAVLGEVLTPQSYVAAERLGRMMFDESMSALAELGVPAYGSVFAFKGSVVFHHRAATNYREFLEIDTAVSHLRYLVQHNGGVFMAPWAKTESWTLSTMHTDADTQLFVANMRRCAELVASITDRHSELFAVGSVT